MIPALLLSQYHVLCHSLVTSSSQHYAIAMQAILLFRMYFFQACEAARWLHGNSILHACTRMQGLSKVFFAVHIHWHQLLYLLQLH